MEQQAAHSRFKFWYDKSMKRPRKLSVQVRRARAAFAVGARVEQAEAWRRKDKARGRAGLRLRRWKGEGQVTL